MVEDAGKEFRSNKVRAQIEALEELTATLRQQAGMPLMPFPVLPLELNSGSRTVASGSDQDTPATKTAESQTDDLARQHDAGKEVTPFLVQLANVSNAQLASLSNDLRTRIKGVIHTCVSDSRKIIETSKQDISKSSDDVLASIQDVKKQSFDHNISGLQEGQIVISVDKLEAIVNSLEAGRKEALGALEKVEESIEKLARVEGAIAEQNDSEDRVIVFPSLQKALQR